MLFHPNIASAFLLLAASATLAVSGSGCAVAPATVTRISDLGPRPLRGCSYAAHGLGELLQKSLDDPASDESAHALAHFVEQWQRLRGDQDSGKVSLPASGEGETPREFTVRFAGGPMPCYPLTYFDEISPAVDYKIKRLPHFQRDGVGAPLAALRENKGREAIEEHFPPEAITRPLTALITKESDNQARIDLLCPLYHEQIDYHGERRPLAADYSVPWAMALSRTRELSRLRLADVLSPMPKRDPKLYLMEPYDPNREPLIMIHGLLDTPLVWAKLSNELWADEAVRSRYQVWHFLYNTSAPALYSGRQLRTQLRELCLELDPEGDDPATQSVTLLAHSMGGIVARSLVTRPEDAFWDAAFTRPFESLNLSENDRETLREAFFWEPDPRVKRIVYITVPHLGSDFADNPIGQLGTWLIKPPNQFAAFYERVSAANPGAFTEAYAELGRGKLDSVHALSPRQPSLKILANLPNAVPVREFSIIGNRGKAGPLEASSDGVVPYWSSHIGRAESETIVPYNHYAIDHEQTVTEIKRILALP